MKSLHEHQISELHVGMKVVHISGARGSIEQIKPTKTIKYQDKVLPAPNCEYIIYIGLENGCTMMCSPKTNTIKVVQKEQQNAQRTSNNNS